jgi:hypothetical protein
VLVTEPTEKKQPKRLTKFKLVRQAVDEIDEHVTFDDEMVPRCCREECRHFDGKRCGRTGNEPEQTCRPAVGKLVKLATALDLVLFEDKGKSI